MESNQDRYELLELIHNATELLDKAKKKIELMYLTELKLKPDKILQVITNSVLKYFNITELELRNNSRLSKLVQARQIYSKLANELVHGQLTQQEIGDYINYDRTLVIRAIKELDKFSNTNDKIWIHYKNIKDIVNIKLKELNLKKVKK